MRLSGQLSKVFGQGFGRRSLFRMVQFAEFFPDEQIVSALSIQLGWSHFIELLSIDDALKRDFYAEMCRIERWSLRTLRHKIGHLLFERTAVSKKPDELIAQDRFQAADKGQMELYLRWLEKHDTRPGRRYTRLPFPATDSLREEQRYGCA
jgi:hypothetical protein